jgi:predicted nucleic acid-binding Zn ribbon protein
MKRTYQDGNKGPELVGEVISRLFTARGWGRVSERQRLEQAWAAACGEELARLTRVNGIRRGVLDIDVANPMLLHELAGFHKRRLLEALKKEMPGMPMKDIRFRTAKL